MTKEAFRQIVRGIFDKAREVLAKMVKGVVVFAGEALSACETRKAAADIQAQGYLSNLQRQALREPPIIYLDSVQENAILPPEFCGMNTYIKLNNDQAEQAFQHMLKQHALDAESREELADTVAPLVGVPTLLEPVYMAHRYIGERLILPYANHGKPDEYKKVYEDIVNDPVYTGTNQGICLKFNIHSADLCRKFCREYEHSRKYIAKLVNGLQRIGVQIDHVSADGIYLEVYLKWTEV